MVIVKRFTERKNAFGFSSKTGSRNQRIVRSAAMIMRFDVDFSRMIAVRVRRYRECAPF